MKTATKSPISTQELLLSSTTNLVHYLGVVNYATNERVLTDIKRLLAAGVEPRMVVTSAGGPSGTAMSLYDTLRHVLGARITTVGSGDVDSSGMVVFLSGMRRFVTPHTTALLHPAGRHFAAGVRHTTAELAAMLAEDTAKDELYADIVAANSGGKLGSTQVLDMMRAHTVLRAEDFVRLGLAEAVLG